MKKNVHIAALACIAVVASILSTSAFAVASSLTVTGPTATKLTLFSQTGSKVASGVGDMSADKLPPGSYQVVAEDASGQTKTTNIQVDRDTSCNYRVNENGEAQRIRCIPLADQQQQQQQQQEPLDFVFLGGYKRTPYDAHVSSNIPAMGDIGLKDNGGTFTLESRYHFPNDDGSRDDTFAYGGIDWYGGISKTRIPLDFHFPVPGDETGAKMEEKYAFRLGVGKSWDLGNKWGLELMGGAHFTRVSSSIITNEGGPNQEFKKSKFVVGPSLGLGLTFPLYSMPGTNRPVMGTARYTANWMPNVNVSGMSTFPFDYSAKFKGGRQDNFQLGLIMQY